MMAQCVTCSGLILKVSCPLCVCVCVCVFVQSLSHPADLF